MIVDYGWIPMAVLLLTILASKAFKPGSKGDTVCMIVALVALAALVVVGVFAFIELFDYNPEGAG